MTKTIVFATIITGVLVTGLFIGITISAEEQLSCPEGEVIVVRTNNPYQICISENTAQRWVQLGIATIVSDKMESAEVTDEMESTETTRVEVNVDYLDSYLIGQNGSGLDFYQRNGNIVNVSPGQNSASKANCPPGEVTIGGSFAKASGKSGDEQIIQQMTVGYNGGWYMSIKNTGPNDFNWYAVAYCLKLAQEPQVEGTISGMFANATTYDNLGPTTVVKPGRNGAAWAFCDVNDPVTGGTYGAFGTTTSNIDYIQTSERAREGSYVITIANTGTASISLSARAICLDNPIPILTP